MKCNLIFVNLIFSFSNLLGQNITWTDFERHITYENGAEESIGIFLKSKADDEIQEKLTKLTSQEKEDMQIDETEYKQAKFIRKSITNIVKENIEILLDTYNGQTLLAEIIKLLQEKDEKITFCFCIDGIQVNNLNFSIDPFDLYSSTNFYLRGGSIEKRALPDVYFFHELCHIYHYLLNDDIFTKLGNGNLLEDYHSSEFPLPEKEEEEKKTNIFRYHFPSTIPQKTDYEEMRTILGIPSKRPIDDRIWKDLICENSYRQEKGYKLRINLLDGRLPIKKWGKHNR